MADMAVAARKSLEEYLALEYPLNVFADPDGGYVAAFPDLPGCLTQGDTLQELAGMADDARRLWIETAYEHGIDIPLPSYPEEHSGKFNVRVSRSLHRSLVEAAERQDVSLNAYVVSLLARGDAQARVEHRLEALEKQLAAINDRLRFQVTGVPAAPAGVRTLSVIAQGEVVAA